ncbi:MAG: hypothetical protein JWL76_618 [Thermoleophilia bacterium]|nr:hypothetical protein [Thermoleophilia bacterium]
MTSALKQYPLPSPSRDVASVMLRRFAETGRWPQPSWVETRLRGKAVDTFQVLRDMPESWTWGNARWADQHLHEPIGLRLDALARLPEAQPLVDLFLWALARMHWAEQPKDNDDPDSPRIRTWSSANARQQRPDLTDVQLRQIQYLVETEHHLSTARSGPSPDDGAWTFTLSPELQHYPDVASIDEYFAKRHERSRRVALPDHLVLERQMTVVTAHSSAPVAAQPATPFASRLLSAFKNVVDFANAPMWQAIVAISSAALVLGGGIAWAVGRLG